MNNKLILSILTIALAIYFIIQKNIDNLLIVILVFIIFFFTRSNGNMGFEFLDPTISSTTSTPSPSITSSVPAEVLQNLASVYNNGVLKVDQIECNNIHARQGINTDVYGKFGNIDIQGDSRNIISRGGDLNITSDGNTKLSSGNSGNVLVTSANNAEIYGGQNLVMHSDNTTDLYGKNKCVSHSDGIMNTFAGKYHLNMSANDDVLQKNNAGMQLGTHNNINFGKDGNIYYYRCDGWIPQNMAWEFSGGGCKK